jgi:hypothetical protein
MNHVKPCGRGTKDRVATKAKPSCLRYGEATVRALLRVLPSPEANEKSSAVLALLLVMIEPFDAR